MAQDVRDVLVLDRGGPRVWIALDGAPDGLTADSAPGRLSLTLQGYSVGEARRIIPMNGGLLTGMTVSPAQNGAALMLEGRFQSAEAELRQGGVWIVLDGAMNDAAGRVAVDAEAYLDAAPHRSTETPSGTSAMADASAGGTGQPGAEPAASMGDAGPGAPTALDADRSMPANPASATPAVSAPAEPVSDPETAQAGIAASEAASAPCDGTAARVQESPWDLDVLAAHADCLVTLGQRDNAAGLYERVLAFEPTHFRANIGLARIREAQGRGQEAAGLYERAASAAMTDGEALAAQDAANRNRGGDR